ncbi:MAG TPA: hypothetical protein VFC65_13765 [Prolixibacteraceae bacterium]|nr:hypothetical protein [Prolixibacteraceae bacterium]
MNLKKHESIQFLVDQYDLESVEEYVFMFSYILGLSDSFDESTKYGMHIFLGDLRTFRLLLEDELHKESEI